VFFSYLVSQPISKMSSVIRPMPARVSISLFILVSSQEQAVSDLQVTPGLL